MKRKIVSLIVSIAGVFVFAQLSTASIHAATFTFSGHLTNAACSDRAPAQVNKLIQIYAHGDGSHAPYQDYFAVTNSVGDFSVEMTYVDEAFLHYHAIPPSGWNDLLLFQEDTTVCWDPYLF